MSEIIWYSNEKNSSNIAPSYHASSSNATRPASHAFDGSQTTFWLNNSNRPVADSYIYIDFKEKKKVNRVSISSPYRFPTKFKVQFSDSDNPTVWNDVLEVQKSDWVASTPYIFEIEKVNEGSAWRIYTLESADITTVAIGELRFGLFEPISKSLILHDGEYKSYNKFLSSYSGELIPKLTSNEFSDGSVSVSSYLSNNDIYKPYKLFDDDPATFWHSNTNSGESWILYNSNERVKLREIVMVNRTDTYADEAPIDFKVQGSNQNNTWVDIKNFTSVVWSALGQTKSFSLSENQEYYINHRILISLSGGRGYAALSKLQFIGDTFRLMNFDWESISQNTPASQQFILKGMDSLSPLLDRRIETLEPKTMTDKTSILLASGEAGKVFSQTIDLKKYLDIRSIKVEVE